MCNKKLLFLSFLPKASFQTCLCTDSISLMRRMRREQPKRFCVCRTRINWTLKVSPKANCQVRGSTPVTPTLVFISYKAPSPSDSSSRDKLSLQDFQRGTNQTHPHYQWVSETSVKLRQLFCIIFVNACAYFISCTFL